MSGGRLLGLVGVLSFVLIAIAGLVEPLWDVPGTRTSGSAIAAYLARERDDFIAALTIYAVGMGLFLAFTAGLWSWLRQRGADAFLGTTFVAGCASLTTLVFAGFVPMLVLAYRAPKIGPGTARVLYDLSFGLLAISGIPTAVAMAAFAGLVLRASVLPAITGWIAAVAAVAHVLIAASFVPDSGFFSLEGGVIVAIPSTLFAWLLATSAAVLAGHQDRNDAGTA